MNKNGNYLFEVIEDARARVSYLANATPEEIRRWKLKKALQILSVDMARTGCPHSAHGWSPQEEPARCKGCNMSPHVRERTRVQCWQEWAFYEVDKDILRAQMVALEGVGLDDEG